MKSCLNGLSSTEIKQSTLVQLDLGFLNHVTKLAENNSNLTTGNERGHTNLSKVSILSATEQLMNIF